MSKLSETYTAIIKGIQEKGFNVNCTVDKITVTNPTSKEVIFEGDIEEAEQWLFTKDFSGLWDLKHPPMHFNCPCAFIVIECPPFRRNATICALLCIIVMLIADFTPNKELGFYLGFPGFALLFLAFSNAVRHFRWERNKI